MFNTTGARAARTPRPVATQHRPHPGACRALIGVRVSTDEQLDRYGPEVQARACLVIAERERLAADPDADVVTISQSVTRYADATELQSLDGAFYAAIIERLKTRAYCAYLTYDMTRLTRSGVLHQLLLEQEVKRYAPRILYANLAGVDTSTPEGETFKVIMAAVNRLRTVLDLARLAAARTRQAAAGFYVGGVVPLGYALELDREASARRKRQTYRLIPYPPHVATVEAMLRALIEHRGNAWRAARALRRAGATVPDFAPELADVMRGRSALKGAARREGAPQGGWAISPNMLAAAARQPAYEGAIIWGGREVRREPRLAIVDVGLLAAARAAVDACPPKPRGRSARAEHDPPPLAGLLRCLGPVDAPHDGPLPMGAAAAPARAYHCRRAFRRGTGRICADIAAAHVDGPLAAFALRRLHLGALADEVTSALDRERAVRAARDEEREAKRRHLRRELVALEGNLEMLLSSQLLSPERFGRMEAAIAATRAELADLDRPTEETARAGTDADGAAVVRRALDGLATRWPTMSDRAKGELLSLFLERVDLAHDGALVWLRLVWITGDRDLLEIRRPGYRARADAAWTAAEDATLCALYPTVGWVDLLAALPGRSRDGIKHRAHLLGLRRPAERAPKATGWRVRRWTADDLAALALYARGELSLAELRARTGRTTEAIMARMAMLGLTRTGPRSAPAVSWRAVEGAESAWMEQSERACTATRTVGLVDTLLADLARLARLARLPDGAP